MKETKIGGKDKRTNVNNIKKLSTGIALLGLTLGVNVGDAHALTIPTIEGITFNYIKLDVGFSYGKIPAFNWGKVEVTDFTFIKLSPNSAEVSAINLLSDVDSLSFILNIQNSNSGDKLSVYWEDSLLQTLSLDSFITNQWYKVEGISLSQFAGSEGNLTFVLISDATESTSLIEIQDIMTNRPGDSSPVPEPTTLVLVGSGLISLAGFRKKIKK
jgi:hypothetical protein